MNINRFDRISFQSANFLVESADTPKIKAGGSSNSNVLNRFFNAVSGDISLLATRSNILATRSLRIENAAIAQSGALNATLTSLSTRVDAASGYTQILASIHSSNYVDNTSTADISQIFGQALLPISSSTDLIVQTDVYGNKIVSPEIEVSYAQSTATSPSSISIDTFQANDDGVYMLKEEQLFIQPGSTSSTSWFKIKVPLQFRGLNPNILEIWPFPAFDCELKGVWYQKLGDSNTGTWYSLDLSYLPGYDTSSLTVKKAGPIRLMLSGDPISQLCFGLKPSSANYVGVKRVKLYHYEFGNTATLVLKDPYNRTLGNVFLRGKDPSDLSLLNISKVGNKATITLTSTNATNSPLITGSVISVS